MAPSSPRAFLALSSPSPYARSLGVRRGDVVIGLKGKPAEGTARHLLKQLRSAGDARQLITLRRGDDIWMVSCRTAELGRWSATDTYTADPLMPDAPRTPPRNWDVMFGPDFSYDVQRQDPTLLGLLTPVYLVQMRLWTELLLWGAVVLLCLPFGGIITGIVQGLMSLYLWRAGPVLVRKDRAAQGFVLWRVIAVQSESDLHRFLAQTRPEMRFVHAPHPRDQDAGPA